MKEKRDNNGPVAWSMVIPTTVELMRQFTSKKISEKELLYKTPLQRKVSCIVSLLGARVA